MLSLRQLDDVCLMKSRNHERCRYLSQDENDSSMFYCLKLSSKRDEIDDEVEDFIIESRKLGRDPTKDNLPLGDNCSGYKLFRNILQGYDC